jgi:CheY-like chemotaxis protein
MSHVDQLVESSARPSIQRRPFGVLVVDDDDGVRRLIVVGMRRRGFAIWSAAGEREALELYRAHGGAIDMVLMDVRMPGRDGPQVLAALREQHPQVRCCFMSGDPGEHTEDGLRELGALSVFHKPFRVDDMAQSLRDLVAPADGETC